MPICYIIPEISGFISSSPYWPLQKEPKTKQKQTTHTQNKQTHQKIKPKYMIDAAHAISGCTSTANLPGPSASYHTKHYAYISLLFLSGLSSKLTELSPTHLRSEKVVLNNILPSFYHLAEKWIWRFPEGSFITKNCFQSLDKSSWPWQAETQPLQLWGPSICCKHWSQNQLVY